MITDGRIAKLQDEAAREGDHELVKLCEQALGIYINSDGSRPTELVILLAREVLDMVIELT